MQEARKTTAERLGAFSDAVIAVIITIMVLELKAPEESATFSALLPLWPTAVSYAISYLFIAIIWLNHHYLLRFVKHVTPALIWVNFVHLFFVSLVPFTTAWIARTHLASAPVALYAGIFVCIDLAYRVFERQAFDQADASELSEHVRHIARRRSLITVLIFAAAVVCAIVTPWLGFALVCCALFSYLAPELRILHFARRPQA
ncbi:putative membrane protein [Nitrobacteraceae bacterium AZCC 1564]